MKRETNRILHVAHVWKAAAVTQDIIRNHVVRKLELNNEFVKMRVRVAHEHAHEPLRDFIRTKERREERAILWRGSADNLPDHGSLYIYRSTHSDISISSPPHIDNIQLECFVLVAL